MTVDWDNGLGDKVQNIVYRAVNNAFDERIPKLIQDINVACDLRQAKCSACRIFSDPENVKAFYSVQTQINAHIDGHKKRDAWLWKAILILTSGTIYEIIHSFFKKQ